MTKQTPLAVRREVLLTWAAIAFCLVSLVFFYRDVALAVASGETRGIEGALLAFLITALVYGSLVYLVARWGYLRREGLHQPRIDTDGCEYARDRHAPRVCVLIPSYKEEIGVLRQTIVSAALAEYPSRRIVVLIDDPPSGTVEDRAALQSTRDMVKQLADWFGMEATRLNDERDAFHSRRRDHCDLRSEVKHLAELYDGLGSWVRTLGDACVIREPDSGDHTDMFFVNSVIAASVDAHRARARVVRESIRDEPTLVHEYQRLVSLLDLSITNFERKQYANLSHAPNKAMNLNSYIGLMGGRFHITGNTRHSRLERCDCLAPGHLVVEEAEYLLTLDADSIVLPNYLATLVEILRSDRSIAVAQTPYSAIPGSPNRLERAAGAQTDVQYMVHQGFTAFNATFWVGANAVLRLAALRDIKTTLRERDNEVPVFIQDRTVIEDTGSTIDLVRRGWRLHNHPERLAYSATPQDFGSLIIQRRRWSNGGLIILPDLVRHAFNRGVTRPKFAEALIRAHYLCSPALVGFSVLLLLLIPFASTLESPWIAATALPYYALYARDVRRARYRWKELPQIYALGLMLLPVNLAGVLRSIQQILTGRKSAFGRTPKIEDRTPTPALHVGFQLALLCAIGTMSAHYAIGRHYYLAAFCALNFIAMGAGILLFLGPRNALADLCPRLPDGWQHAFRLLASSAASPGKNTTRPAGEGGRIEGLDGLRAYAISLVFLVHFLAQYFNGTTAPRHIDFDAFQWTRAENFVDVAVYYLWASHYGVDLFFLLSGFLIYRLISRPAFSYSQFLGHRFMRLYPAFGIALVIYCLYVGHFWNLRYDWTTVAANAVMLQGIWELGIKPIIVPTWSLTFEWLFYLVFPVILLFPGARLKPSLRHIALFAAVIVALIAPIGPHYVRFLMFLAGAAMASIRPALIRERLKGTPDLAILIVYAIGNLLFVDEQNYIRFIPVYVLTSVLLVAKVVYGDGFLHRLFSAETLSHLGKVSYSFYLFHGLMIIIVCDHLGPLLVGLPEALRFTLLIACSFATSTAVATLSYRLVERPYFERRGAGVSWATR